MAQGPSCSAACGIFPDQGSNPRPLRWQADSQPLRHQGSPGLLVLYPRLPIPSPGLWSPQKACVHLGQESGPSTSRPQLPRPPLQPETSNYLCGGAAPGSVSILPRCAWQAQPSLNDTLPACPPAGVGGEGARPSLSHGFFFHCVRPQGLACLPAAGWHRGAHSDPRLPQLQTSCAPRFGDPEASKQRVSWGWGTCP